MIVVVKKRMDMEEKRKVLELTEQDRAELVRIVQKGRDWRMRDRAQTVLYFSEGWKAKAIATEQNLHLDTVYDRRKNWLARGLASLADKHRSGAPAKLNGGHEEQLKLWATQQALTSRQLLSQLHEEFDVRIHANTLTSTLKKMGLVWKRTRHSLKKSAMK